MAGGYSVPDRPRLRRVARLAATRRCSMGHLETLPGQAGQGVEGAMRGHVAGEEINGLEVAPDRAGRRVG